MAIDRYKVFTIGAGKKLKIYAQPYGGTPIGAEDIARALEERDMLWALRRGCSQHLDYHGVRLPENDCPECKELWSYALRLSEKSYIYHGEGVA
jgi:hypothetical protein